MPNTRKKNYDWNIKTNADGTTPMQDAHLATLMDLRDELQKLNAVFSCHRFQNIPHVLDRISANTRKPKRRKMKIAK